MIANSPRRTQLAQTYTKTTVSSKSGYVQLLPWIDGTSVQCRKKRTKQQKKLQYFFPKNEIKKLRKTFFMSRPRSTFVSETDPEINSFFLKWLSRSSVISWLCGRLSRLSWNDSDTPCALCKDLLFPLPNTVYYRQTVALSFHDFH